MRLPGRKRFEVKASRPTTEQPKPRVLVYGDHEAGLVERLRERVATVGVVRWLSDVDLHEWDCLVTRHSWTTLDFTPGVEGHYNDSTEDHWNWTQNLPPHMSVVYADMPAEHRRSSLDFLDFWPPNGEGSIKPDLVVVAEHGVKGAHVSLAEGLPDHLTEVVRRHLLPVAEARAHHTIFDLRGDDVDRENGLHLTPLLYGPRESYLAALYERTDQASVWLLPDDVQDLVPWVLAALREWHDQYPDRFPSLPDWPNDARFRTQQETRLHAELQTKTNTIQQAIDDFLAAKKDLDERLELAGEAASSFERALLTEQGEPLATAIHKALTALGFLVRDMDAERAGQPKKEDFRLTDLDAIGWEAIAEAKGFTKNIKETGLVSLGRWATAYVLETRKEPSARWYIANQQIREDPDTRPAPFDTRPDFVEVLEETGTLLIDTYALFRLTRAVQDNPALAAPVRARLRDRVGRLGPAEVTALLLAVRADGDEQAAG